MADLKAIETRYKGYKFRSRLEARWAVFFDALGIKYEYEKEGFEIQLLQPDSDDGVPWQTGKMVRYLPDFWLPELNMWAEVKPEEFREDEFAKIFALSYWGDTDCLMLVGPPDYNGYKTVRGFLYYFRTFDHTAKDYGQAMLHAIEKARSARFEYGETPR